LRAGLGVSGDGLWVRGGGNSFGVSADASFNNNLSIPSSVDISSAGANMTNTLSTD